MEILTATFKIVTPMFLGGANPNDHAELREPSIKAALRFWYRAIDPDFQGHESRIFGGTDKGAGQSIFMLRLSSGMRTGDQKWDPTNYKHFNTQNSKFASRPDHASNRNNTWTLNGVRYFSSMVLNDRKYIPEEKEFTLTMNFRKEPCPDDRRRIAATLWLLGHVGGLGSRSRRGFGTVALQSWAKTPITPTDTWPEMDLLAIAHKEENVVDWWEHFKESLKTLKTWFPGVPLNDHAVFGQKTKFKLFNNATKSWDSALNEAGKVMQRFRQRHDMTNPKSDYIRIKKHLVKNDPNTAGIPGAGVGAAMYTGNGPDRAAFGLPLTFRYSSLAYQKKEKGKLQFKKDGKPVMKTPETTFQGQLHDRSASSIHVRIVKIKQKYYPLYIRLDGPLLENGERIRDMWGNYGAPGNNILDSFWETLTTPLKEDW